MTTKEFIIKLVENYRVDPENYETGIDLIRSFLDREVKETELYPLFQKTCRECKFFPRVDELSGLYYFHIHRADPAPSATSFNMEVINKLKALRTKIKKLDREGKPVNWNEWTYFSGNEWLLDKYESIHGYECITKQVTPEELQKVLPWEKANAV